MTTSFPPAKPGAGDSGGTPTPPSGTLADNEMLKSNVGGTAIVGTGDTNTDVEVNFGTKTLRAAAGAFDSGTLDMVGYQQGERGGYLQTISKVTGRTFISVDYQIDDTGTQKPLYDSRGAQIVRQVKQSDDTITILGLTSYIVIPDSSQDISNVYFKFVNPVTNFRARVISDTTGLPVAYIPSRSAYEKGEGLSLGSGEQTFAPEHALPELVGFGLTVEVFADQSIDVLGDGSSNPWRAVDVQDIISLQMLDESDIAIESNATSWINGGDITQNTTTTIDIAAGSGRIVSIDGNGKPIIVDRPWNQQLNVALPDIATTLATRVGIDQNGDFIALDPTVTPANQRNYVILGIVSHAAGTIDNIVQDGLKAQQLYNQYVDTLETLGVTNRGGGFAITPNADLTFQKAAGELEASGAGIASGNVGQNIIAIPGETPATFSRILGATDDVDTFSTTLVDPGFYDNGTGTKVAVPLATNATIVYLFQSVSGNLSYMYGQTVYTDISEARLNADEDFAQRPITIRRESNLIARIALQADATALNDPSKAVFLGGVKFGSGLDGGLTGSSGGGGDVIGGVSSTTNEIVRHADASGKVIEAGSDITADTGVLQRITAGQDLTLSPNGAGAVNVANSSFAAGDALSYPAADGLAGDKITTDAAGNLTFDDEKFELLTISSTLEYNDKLGYIDSSAGPMTLTLGDNPRVGERKLLWMGDNTNEVTLTTANPAFPIDPQTPPAEANIQGMWTLGSDFLDRFSTDRDLTNSGTGGVFEAGTVNGNAVQVFNFQQTAYLEAVASAYKGVTGGSARSFTCWYAANAGTPTGDETLVAWGEDIPPGGLLWEIDFRMSQGYMWINNRNASRRWNTATLEAVNLFDGNFHHIAVTQSNSNMGSINLYIDGVRVIHDFQDTFPVCTTSANTNFRLGANYTGGTRLNGKLYDCRLFNRGLTEQEVNEILGENILGSITLSALNNDMVIDVTYNGAQWKLGVGTESLIGSIDGRLTALEDSSLRGAGSSLANQIVTYADDTGLISDNASGMTVVDGLFIKDGITPNITIQTTGLNGDVTLETLSQELRLNDTTGNIEITDGADGEHNLFFGRHRMRNPSDSPGIFLEDSTGSTLSGSIWDTDDGGSLYTFNGSLITAPDSYTRLYDTYFKVSAPTIVNSGEAITAQGLQVNDEFSDAGTVTYYENVPLMVNLLTNNGGNIPAAPETVLSLHRSGIPAEAYGNSARFDLSRYENASTNMRTQMDIRLGHAQPTTGSENDNTPIIMTMKSSGRVDVPGTLFVNGAEVIGGSSIRTVYFSVQRRSTYNVPIGFEQDVASGTVSIYEVDGATTTPQFASGVWTVDVAGTYMITVEGWLDRTDIGYDRDRVLITVAKNDFAYGVTQPGYSEDLIIGNARDVGSINTTGIMQLEAGDNVRLKTRNVGSTTNWEILDFNWKAVLINT